MKDLQLSDIFSVMNRVKTLDPNTTTPIVLPEFIVQRLINDVEVDTRLVPDYKDETVPKGGFHYCHGNKHHEILSWEDVGAKLKAQERTIEILDSGVKSLQEELEMAEIRIAKLQKAISDLVIGDKL